MLDPKAREWLSMPSCSVAQTAKLLGMSKPTVLRAVDRGEIQGTRIGKRIIIPTAPLRKILMLDEAAGPSSNAA